MTEQSKHQPDWLDRPLVKSFPGFTREKFIITVIILLAVLSRFANLGDRVMSHDEVNHVVPSYNLYKGAGYAHDPVTHGPFQFHIVALSYFMFGDNDYTSRVPAALFSVAAVIFVLFAFRRYLGRIGALVGGFLFLISPFLLFYGRYTRNEGFIELIAVVMFYAVLRYFEKRDNFSLYLLMVAIVMLFVTKEVSYIYAAQLLLFCGFLFLADLWNLLQNRTEIRRKGLVLLLSAVFLLLAGAGFYLLAAADSSLRVASLVIAGSRVLVAVAAVIFLFGKTGWAALRQLPSFNLIVFVGALVLPHLAAFPIQLIGWDPLDYTAAGMVRTGIVLAILLAVSFLIGIWWNRNVFLKSAAAFYLIFITFYTTLFSNGQGFFTGIIGSLGYWLSQHEVQRGGQPFYYYGMILIPIYEFAALAGTILAVFIAARHRKFFQKPGSRLSGDASDKNGVDQPEGEETSFIASLPVDYPSDFGETFGSSAELPAEDTKVLHEGSADITGTELPADLREEEPESQESIPATPLFVYRDDGKIPTLLLLLYWSLSALLAYSVAGEKMPWLTVHITLPLCLSAAWGIGYLLEVFPWDKFLSKNGLIGIVVLITGGFALNGLLNTLSGPVLPFSGKELAQMKATNQFILAAAVFLVSFFVLIRVWKKWQAKAILKTLTLLILAVLCTLQARTAYVSAFINYDTAKEFLVYAHAGPGPKVVLRQIEEIAARTGEGKSIKVAYDNDALYPYWWYFRDYPAKNYFGEGNPTRELRDYDIIIANTTKEGRLEPIVRNGYYRFEHVRLWWPNQDYWNLTPGRILDALSDPAMRSALFDIWLNRDYTKYAMATGKTTLTLETWEPSARMVVYMKKDLLQKMWSLGDFSTLAQEQTDSQDAFVDEKFVEINPVLTIGGPGSEAGQFTAPRGVAVAENGRVYVLDSDNNRVQYFSAAGEYLGMWDAAERGGLNQPWGIAAGPDNSIYVADTWNHRMLKFDADGQFLAEWYANDPSDPTKTFYGPRSVAVDGNGRVFVSDTGNKRIMVYSDSGEFIGKFGTSGMGEGELDEPVGIAIFEDKWLAVADTWNQRVQIFDISGSNPSAFRVTKTFEVQAWYSQSLDNKPYVAFTKEGNVLISDPESYLIWEFTMAGELVRSWNGGGGNIDSVSMPTGIMVDGNGAVWVVDTSAAKVNKFILP